jgi:hypothetical protein
MIIFLNRFRERGYSFPNLIKGRKKKQDFRDSRFAFITISNTQTARLDVQKYLQRRPRKR